MIKHTVAYSMVEPVHLVRQEHINGNGTLFGGTIMKWIDIASAFTGKRHCSGRTTTLMVDNISFIKPAHLADLIYMKAFMTYVSTTSFEVKVEMYIEDFDGSRTLMNTAYVVMVALDENMKPMQVPELVLETDEQKAEWERGRKRHELRKQRRQQQY